MEQVIVVDEENNEICTAEKEMVHTKTTPLHRAFSLFLFNGKKQLLVTQRAHTKKTFPGIWTNSVCGHVSPGETALDACNRRVKEELGVTPHDIREVSPYRYRFSDANGIVENEICPIFIGFTDNDPLPDRKEVGQWRWIDWKEFLLTIQEKPGTFSPWSEEEARMIESRHILNG